jgi:hypothetical protein
MIVAVGLGLLSLESTTQMRKESRRGIHVAPVFFAKLRQHFLFLPSRELYVHSYENRKHDQRDESRPLKQKTKHDQNKADVLRVTHIGIRPRRRQRVCPLSLVQDFHAAPRRMKPPKMKTLLRMCKGSK